MDVILSILGVKLIHVSKQDPLNEKKVSQDQEADSKQICDISCQYKKLHVRDEIRRFYNSLFSPVVFPVLVRIRLHLHIELGPWGMIRGPITI